MAPLILLFTILGSLAAIVLLVVSFIWKKNWLTKLVLSGVFIWFAVYGILLIGSSLSSKEKTIGFNDAKEYCGFYLDCHMHTTVTNVSKTKTIGDQTAKGEFYIVKVKVFSDARNPSIKLHLTQPKAEIKYESGQVFSRKLEIENLLPTARVPLSRDVTANEPFEKDLVFDLPNGTNNPRLDISEGYGIDKVIEAILIGDEDSIFHKRVYFSLDATGKDSKKT